MPSWPARWSVAWDCLPLIIATISPARLHIFIPCLGGEGIGGNPLAIFGHNPPDGAIQYVTAFLRHSATQVGIGDDPGQSSLFVNDHDGTAPFKVFIFA